MSLSCSCVVSGPSTSNSSRSRRRSWSGQSRSCIGGSGRRACGRRGPEVPAPRERDRAVRGLPRTGGPGRRAVGELLAAHGPPEHPGTQDVQVPQELHLHPDRAAGQVHLPPSLHASTHSLSLSAAPSRRTPADSSGCSSCCTSTSEWHRLYRTVWDGMGWVGSVG